MLRIRHLRLRVQTPEGLFGADLPFQDGLMILRADNSRGKSTAIKSMLFALGLERMLTNRPGAILTSAMRDQLIYDAATKAETPVLASWVSLEVEGRDNTVVTITRWGKHEKMAAGLVRVAHAPIGAIDEDTRVEDFFVGRAGAVANPGGFHRWLARFIGWDLPTLPAADGRTAPLYMEQVFPLLFVEQRRGWGGIQAQMPYFSGVTDVRKRSTEFLLDLDVSKNELDRQELRARDRQLQGDWRGLTTAIRSRLHDSGVQLVGVPDDLDIAWPSDAPVPHLARMFDNEWTDVEAVVSALKAQAAQITNSDIPTLTEDRSAEESGLRVGLERLNEIQGEEASLRQAIARDEQEERRVRERIEFLQEDLIEHQDAATLASLGSTTVFGEQLDCPVCHRLLPATLVDAEVPMMTPSDSVAHLKQQISLFETMARDTARVATAKRERWVALRQESAAVAQQVRALRESMSQVAGAPSIAEVTRAVEIRHETRSLDSLLDGFRELTSQLESIVREAIEVRGKLKALPRDELSEGDRHKLNLLQKSFGEQLSEYGFGSFSNEKIHLSNLDYLPRRDDFDLQGDISASDSIRVIWAYLLGLLEVSGSTQTNHPGLIVFDEPRQQSAQDVSFSALLNRAARHGGRQIVFATSEDRARLESMLTSIPHSLVVVDGYLLKRVDN